MKSLPRWLSAFALVGLLSSCALFGIAGCGGTQPASEGSASSDAPAAASSDASSQAASDASAASTEGGSESASSEAAASESSAPQEYTAGTVTDAGYVNEFFGIKFDKPADWTVSDPAAVAETMGEAASSMEYLANSATGNNVNIVVDTRDVALQGAQDANAYVAMATDAVKQSLESQGAEEVSVTAGTTTLAGAERPCLNIEFSLQGTPVKQKSIIVEEGDRVAAITVTGLDVEPDELLTMFSANA